MRVEFPSGTDSINGELYTPEGEGSYPGVVIIPDVYGLSQLYSDFALKFAESGFMGLVLDPYSRGEAPDLSSLEAVWKFLREFSTPQVLGDVQAAVDYLADRSETEGRVGVTGFCVGGQYTILGACSCAGISAAVSWYGMLRVQEVDVRHPEHPLDALRRLSCPLLALFGKDDALIPAKDVAEFERRASNLQVQTVVYPDAGHAFANTGRPDAYRPKAAQDAWDRTLAFFRRHL